DCPVDRVTLVQAGFAAAVVVVGASLAAALRGAIGARALAALASLVGLGAVAAWVSFALDPSRGVAIAAAGLTAAATVEAGLTRVRRAPARVHRIDDETSRAEPHLREPVESEVAPHAPELERGLARARAEATALLPDQGRPLPEERPK